MKVVYFAPEGFGYSSNQMTEGLHLLSKTCRASAMLLRTSDRKTADEIDLELYVTNKMVHHGSQIEDLELTTDQEAYDNCYDADLILFASDGDMKFLDGISGEAFRNEEFWNRIVFLDGHDSDHLLADPEKMLMYLKREFRLPQANTMVYPNVRGFTFGIYQFLLDNPPPPDDYDDRDIDFSFVAFGGSNPARSTCAEVLRHLHGQDMGNGKTCNVVAMCPDHGQPLSIPEYRDIMRRTKVGVSVMGAGYDTLRYWETMAHGAVLSSIDLNPVLHVRDMPEPHRHCIYFDSWNRMAELSRLVVSDRDRWLCMRRATDELIKCHSTTKRAELMIKMAAELS